MKKLVFALVITFALSASAVAGDIAVSSHAGWFDQGPADRESQEIVDNVTAVAVQVFPQDQQDALADWVVAHTGNGQVDLLVLMGRLPASIYPAGNASPDGSKAELFLDDGNIIVNTGDYCFYVTSAGSNNGDSGLKNMMDANYDMWEWDNPDHTVTADGAAICPSLTNFYSPRPFHLGQIQAPWFPELILSQNAAGNTADPVIMANTATGGRVGIFYQTAGKNDEPRGEVISEWINNWYLADLPAVPNLAGGPNPADGAIDVDIASVEWLGGHASVSYKVYVSKDASIDAADLVGEPTMALQVVVLDPGATYYWRVDCVDADGAVTEGPVWTFDTLPVEAHFPVPVDGATNAPLGGVTLGITPGKGAIMHNFYFGTNPDALPPLAMMTMDTTADTGPLQAGTTYYWRVNEFTPLDVPGPVWSFSTTPDVPAAEPNLIAAYEFNEDELTLSALDSSGNNRHGTLLGNAAIGDGALSPNGSAVNCGSDPAYHPAGSLSISCYVKMTGWGNSWGNAIIGTRGESGLGWQLRRHSGNSQLTFTIRGTTGADDPRGNITPPLNEWMHVAAVYNAEAGYRAVYINGTPDVQIDDTGTMAASDHPMFVGSRSSGGGDPEQSFNGQIDYVKVYDRALSLDEIRAVGADLAIAWLPTPASGTGGLLASDVVLSWNPGEGAQMQDIYIGADAAAVEAATAADTSGIYQGRQAETTFTPADIPWGATTYWRVDQVTVDGSTTCIAKGPVWSLSTQTAVLPSANLGACETDVPGFLIRALKAQSEINNFGEMNTILDTGLLDDEPPVPGSEGVRIDQFCNVRDTGNGAFGEDKSFPGIDALQEPAPDPADGDDDNDFATEVLGCIQLTAGVHTIGANSDDGTIVWVGGVEIGRSEELKGTSNRDFSFYVVEDGFYEIKAHHFERGGGASLELHEILADGTRLLLNDVANGGSAVFAPPAPDLPGTGPEPVGGDLVEDFESYAVGADMHGVNDWEGWEGAAGAGAPVADTAAMGGSKAVEIIGTSDLVKKLDYQYGSVTLTAKQYIPSGTTGDTFFILMSRYPADMEWNVQDKFSLGSGVLAAEIGGGTADIVYDQWVEIKYVIDLDGNTVEQSYNGAVISTHAWSASNATTIGAIDLYSAGASPIYYDDITITRN
jgi:hypothetical protein